MPDQKDLDVNAAESALADLPRVVRENPALLGPWSACTRVHKVGDGYAWVVRTEGAIFNGIDDTLKEANVATFAIFSTLQELRRRTNETFTPRGYPSLHEDTENV